MTLPSSVCGRDEFVTVRGVRHRLRHWGETGAPRMLLLHGWADVSATFQFIAQQLCRDCHLIAPDWRGCGDSQWLGQPYVLGDLAADLDRLITHCFEGGEPVRVVGHSMGANVAALLAAARPGRIAALAMLDAFGTPHVSGPELLDQLAKSIARSADDLDWCYAGMQTVVDRLLRDDPWLRPEQARWLAGELCDALPDGRVRMRIDPAWRDPLPQLLMPPAIYAEAWRRIEAPVLLVEGETSHVRDRVRASDPEGFSRLLAQLRHPFHVVLANAGHNVHHDVPDEVAAVLEDFFALAR